MVAGPERLYRPDVRDRTLTRGNQDGGSVSQDDLIEGQTIAALTVALRDGRVTSEVLVAAYLDRIGRVDAAGPRAVLAVNPDVIADARAKDTERASGQAAGALYGIPILVKDNIETAEPLPTTAGSLALARNVTKRDAPVVARLRAAGAIILGKANLTEWSNMRDSRAISGWSAIGGQTRNPLALDRTPGGSSSGSVAGVAASLAPAALGTETDGSITHPASFTGLVGLKPTLGLLSRRHVVPISDSQDTVGPITRTVADAALLLTVMAGADLLDPATVDADQRRRNYGAALDADSLAGRRLGVLRFLSGRHEQTDALFEAALATVRRAGAELIEVPSFDNIDTIRAAEKTVLRTELKTGLAAYLESLPGEGMPRSLVDLIAFNKTHADAEMSLFGQDIFEAAELTDSDDPGYLEARVTARRLAGLDGLGRLFAGGLDALIAPTRDPAGPIAPAVSGPINTACLPAVAGYPHITLPMGRVGALPVGLSFIGQAWSEATLLSMAYAYEQRRGTG
jgi:amidase